MWAPPARDGATFPRPHVGCSRILSLGVGAVDQSGDRDPEERSHITTRCFCDYRRQGRIRVER